MSTRARGVYQKLEKETDDAALKDKASAKTPWLKIWRGINYVMVAFFVLSAVVQVSLH